MKILEHNHKFDNHEFDNHNTQSLSPAIHDMQEGKTNSPRDPNTVTINPKQIYQNPKMVPNIKKMK